MSTAVESKIETHEFYARGRNERLVRQPLLHVETALGRKIKQQDRIDYDFAPDGRLTVRDGQDLLPDGPIDPETGEPTMQDALAWLTSHPLCNTRFWREGHEPGRLLPTEEDFLAICTEAVADLKAEPIMVALEQERATHNRKLLVQTAERSLAAIERTLQAIAAQEPPEGAPPPAA